MDNGMTVGSSKCQSWLLLLYWYVVQPRKLQIYREGLEVSGRLCLRQITAMLASLILYLPIILTTLYAVLYEKPIIDKSHLNRTSVFTTVPNFVVEHVQVGTAVIMIGFICLALLTYQGFIARDRTAPSIWIIATLVAALLYFSITSLLGALLEGALSGAALGAVLGLAIGLSITISAGFDMQSSIQLFFYSVSALLLGVGAINGLTLRMSFGAPYPDAIINMFLLVYSATALLGGVLYLRNRSVLQ